MINYRYYNDYITIVTILYGSFTNVLYRNMLPVGAQMPTVDGPASEIRSTTDG